MPERHVASNTNGTIVTIGCLAAYVALFGTPTLAGSNLTTVKSAAQLFGSICQNVYPDVNRAKRTAEANGLRFDAVSGRYVHGTADLQMRIDQKRCGIRFKAKPGSNPPGGTFADYASSIIKKTSDYGQVHVSSDWKPGKTSMTVVATRDN